MKKRGMIGLLSFLLVSALCSPKHTYAMVEVYEASDFQTDAIEAIAYEDEKVFHSSEEFVSEEVIPGSVIVVIKKEYSGLNKKYSVLNFLGVDFTEIEYLTPLRTDIDNPLINYEEYRQILSLRLEDTSVQGVWDAISVLEKNPIVKEALPNYVLSTTEDYETVIPDDEHYDLYQWYLDKIDMPKAWKVTTGSRSVQVGVVDTGIDEHPDLIGNVDIGWNAALGKELQYGDLIGHGTSVASVIGAVGNNGTGMTGVAWNIGLVPIRVSVGVEEEIEFEALINAFNYAQDQGIGILNCSFGGFVKNSGFESAVRNYGGLIVCAAGNESTNVDVTKCYPACYDYDNIISVAATTSNDDLATFSNYGAKEVDLAAPGESIFVANKYEDYVYVSGTSFSVPMVSGAAALLKSYNSDLNAYQMKHAILDNVDEVAALSGKVATGGRLNVYNALSSVMEGQVRNYIVKLDFANNVGAIDNLIVTVGFDKNLLRYCSSTGGDECGGEWITETADAITFNGDFSSYTGQSGDFVTMRFNVPFADVNCLNSFDIDYYDAVMSDSSSAKPNLILYKILLGDVNFDNKIDTSDVELVTSWANGGATLSEQQMLAADFNEDGKINTTDVRKITRYVNKTIDSLN